MSTYVDVTIGDLLTPVGGSPRFIRDYMDAHPGAYAVYSASLVKPFGFVDSFEFDGTFLSWVMNGYGGRMQTLEGKFSLTRDRGLLLPKPGKRTPNLTYLRYAIEPELIALAVGRRVDGRQNEYTKIYPPTVSDVTIRLPILASGAFDHHRMEEIGQRLERIEAAQSKVLLAKTDLNDAALTFLAPEPTTLLNLGDQKYFSLSIGERVLKSQIAEAGIDVYSANARSPFGKVSTSNLADFSKPSLLWGIDGIFDWNLIPAGVAFATTDHCGRLQLLDERLHPEYVLQFLRATRSEYGFDRVFRASLANVAEQVCVRVPTDGAGVISFNRQVELASARQRLIDTQEKTVEALEQVARVRMTVEL